MTDQADQLPAIVPPTRPGALTPLPARQLIPALIADDGDQASWHYIDFFTSNIRNPNTRRAYARACGAFLHWAEERGRTLGTIRPYDVSFIYRVPTANSFRPGREAAARRRPHAV